VSITIYDVLLYFYLSRRFNLPVSFEDWGYLIYHEGVLTPLGGMLAQFEVNDQGIFIRNGQVIVPAGCGHILKTIDDMGGFCGVCRRIICSKDGCLGICDESGITVCRVDRIVTRDGRTVARPEAKKLSSLFKSLTRPKRKEVIDDSGKLLR
jgi:hypothetical protein